MLACLLGLFLLGRLAFGKGVELPRHDTGLANVGLRKAQQGDGLLICANIDAAVADQGIGLGLLYVVERDLVPHLGAIAAVARKHIRVRVVHDQPFRMKRAFGVDVGLKDERLFYGRNGRVFLVVVRIIFGGLTFNFRIFNCILQPLCLQPRC